MNASEAIRRQSNTGKVLALFQSRPWEWISIYELAQVGGFAAWRTRVADARLEAETVGHQIIWNEDCACSGYLYQPYTPTPPMSEWPIVAETLFELR